jgi:hypothetical protein
MWSSTLPTAAAVRKHPWWWHRSPGGELDVLRLMVTGGNDVFHVESGLIIENSYPSGEWAPCIPPEKVSP